MPRLLQNFVTLASAIDSGSLSKRENRREGEMVHGDATALLVATFGPGLQASWLIMNRQFGWPTQAWLAAGSRELARAQPDHGCTITSEISQKVGQPSRTTAQVKMEAFENDPCP